MRRISRELRESIAAYLEATDCENVPPCWLTTKQLERHTGYSQRGVSLILGKIIAAGDAEVRKFKVKAGQVIRPVPHYKFTPRAIAALGLDKRRKT